MKVATIGIDLAKNVFQIHGVDPHGHSVLRKQLKRAQLFTFFCQPPTRPDRHGVLLRVALLRPAPRAFRAHG
jgi:transposase